MMILAWLRTLLIEQYLVFLIYLAVVNLLAGAVFGLDKLKAKRGSRRVSEATLLILALLGGTAGELIAMRLFRHKTMHKRFYLGLPLLLILQLLLLAAVLILG